MKKEWVTSGNLLKCLEKIRKKSEKRESHSDGFKSLEINSHRRRFVSIFLSSLKFLFFNLKEDKRLILTQKNIMEKEEGKECITTAAIFEIVVIRFVTAPTSAAAAFLFFVVVFSAINADRLLHV